MVGVNCFLCQQNFLFQFAFLFPVSFSVNELRLQTLAKKSFNDEKNMKTTYFIRSIRYEIPNKNSNICNYY